MDNKYYIVRGDRSGVFAGNIPDTGFLLTAEKFSCSKFEDLEEEKR